MTQWEGTNISRYRNFECDQLAQELAATAELVGRAVIANRLNDILTKDMYAVVPLKMAKALAKELRDEKSNR